jgi:hypothetical protein
MARKSGWQEFAENFQSTYGIVNKVKQGYDTKQVMNDEKFTGKDGAGAGLKGSALEKARYKALGDIATKYGDTAGGLANRTALADLNAKDRENTINQGIMKELAYIRGQGAVRNLDANSRASEGSAANSYAGADQKKALTPEMVAKYQADTKDVYSGIARRDALLPGEKAQQGAILNATIASTGLTGANTTGQVLENDVATAAAAQQKLETSFLTQVSDPAFWKAQGIEGDPTSDQRQEALINMYKGSDIPIERQMAVESALGKHGIDKLQTVALETAQSAQNEMQKGGLPGLIKWYDGVDDGDATALDIRPVDGGFELFSSSGTGDNRNENVLFSGATEAEIEAQLMGQIKNPGSGMEIAASILDMRQKAASVESIEAQTLFTAENTKGLVGGRRLTSAQINLANVRAREIRAELRQKYTTGGKEELKVQADQKALDKFLNENLALIALDPEMDVDALVEQFLTSRQQTAITFDPAD